MSTRTLLGLATLFAAVGTVSPRAAPAQQAHSAIVADTIRVGDVVPVAVRVTVERGERILWPDTLPLSDEALENVARVRERVDTLADGRLQVTGVYSVTPWRTGELEMPDLPLRVMADREVARTLTAELPTLEVISVLPPDTAGVEPEPAKGVIGRSWSPWPFLLALLALAALIAAVVWWRRRRAEAGVAPPIAPAVSPRERVLARLQEAREADLIEQGAMKEFYSRVSEALREYLEIIGPGWGEDLTTTELLGRFRVQVGPEVAAVLGELLRAADQVKFARRRPDPATAVQEWESVRRWVLGFDWPPRRTSDEQGEAA